MVQLDTDLGRPPAGSMISAWDFASQVPLSEDEWTEYHYKRLAARLRSVDWGGSGRTPLTEAGLLELLKTPFHGQEILARAAELFDRAPSKLRLVTDEGGRPPLLPSPACIWGFGGITVEVMFEQTGGGRKQKRTRSESPSDVYDLEAERAAAVPAAAAESRKKPRAAAAASAAPAPAAPVAAAAASAAVAAPAAAELAARPNINELLRVAISLGIKADGMPAFRQAVVACDFDPERPAEAFQQMQPIVAAYAAGLRGPSEKKQREKAEQVADLLKFPPPIFVASFAKLSSTAGGTDAWSVACPFWRAHVREVLGCEKCAATRNSEQIRVAYTTEGVSRKASDPTQKRACCRWAHSLSARQLVEKAQAAFADKGFKDRDLLPLAKRFMADNMGAAPLGNKHPEKSFLDNQVTLYDDGQRPQSVKPDGSPAGTAGAKHYFVYMGYHWVEGGSAAAGSSSDPCPFPPLAGGHV